MFDKLFSAGKKLSALGSGNPATVATAFAPPDSPYMKAVGAGMAFAGAGGGMKGLGAVASQGNTPMSRAMAMKTQLEDIGAKTQPEPAAAPAQPGPSRFSLGVNTDLTGTLGAMKRRLGY